MTAIIIIVAAIALAGFGTMFTMTFNAKEDNDGLEDIESSTPNNKGEQ